MARLLAVLLTYQNVLDKNGHIRYKHIGEGAYEETAHVVEYLMAE